MSNSVNIFRLTGNDLLKGSVKTLSLILLIISIFFAPEVAQAQVQDTLLNAEYFGILTIIPPLIAITLAFVTKNVVLSLFFGTFAGCVMMQIHAGSRLMALGYSFIDITKYIVGSLGDPWNAGIILQVLTIGSLITLITKLGGVRAIAEAMSKLARTPRSTQFTAWLMGLIIFFDDYANALIVGPMMRPLTDKMRISREKLAFLVDSTSAPIAGMALISTWVAYEIGVINDALATIGSSYNAYGLFVLSLPYRYYNILLFAFMLAAIYFLREFGPMYKAEHRARTTGMLTAKSSEPTSTDTLAPISTVEHEKSSVWYAIIPISTLVFGAFIGFYINGYNNIIATSDNLELIQNLKDSPLSLDSLQISFGASDASVVLFRSALLSCIVAIVMGVSKKLITITQALDTFLTGLQSMNITALILILAWSLSSVMKDVGTATYIVAHLSSTMPAWMLPATIFILGSVISFATGTSYGTMGILMPLAVPLSWAILPEQQFLVISIGAVLTGAIFGDHCSPISDTSILSSMGSSCNLMDHVTTQMPYALTVGALAIVTYLLAGLGVNGWLILLIGISVTVLLVRVAGKRLPDADYSVDATD